MIPNIFCEGNQQNICNSNDWFKIPNILFPLQRESTKIFATVNEIFWLQREWFTVATIFATVLLKYDSQQNFATVKGTTKYLQQYFVAKIPFTTNILL